MDEPCSALDPISTLKIEDLINELKRDRAPSSSSPTTCSRPRASATERRSSRWATTGRAISSRSADTVDIFTNPKNQLTEDYVSGRFG